MKRRSFSLLAGSCLLGAPALAQTARPTIRLVVPFPPGGATDITARTLSAPLARILDQPVVVDNRAGGGGALGMSELARAPADGSVLGLATLSTHGVNPAVYKQLPYDAIKDFTPVTELVKAPGVLVVHPQVKATSVSEFVALLKSQPGRLTYASPGSGTIGHMWGELFKSTTNTFMVHIPYKGAGPALDDLLAGQVHAYFDQVASSLPHIRSGKVRALAVSWSSRLPFLREVPTYAEAALFSNNDPSWFGLVAPAGTPRATVQRLHEAVGKALREPAVAERLASQGLFPSGSAPDEFGRQIAKEVDKMRRISRFAQISLS